MTDVRRFNRRRVSASFDVVTKADSVGSLDVETSLEGGRVVADLMSDFGGSRTSPEGFDCSLK